MRSRVRTSAQLSEPSPAGRYSPWAFLRATGFLAAVERLAAGFLAAERLDPLRRAPPEDEGVLSLAAATDAFSASIRSTTRAGASSVGASIGSPATFFST